MHTVTLSEGQRLSSSSDGADTAAQAVQAVQRHSVLLVWQIVRDAVTLRSLLADAADGADATRESVALTTSKVEAAALVAGRVGMLAEQVIRLHDMKDPLLIGDRELWFVPEALSRATSYGEACELNAARSKGAA